MKVYLFSRKYNLYGFTGVSYSVCTHNKRCDENAEFIHFENRMGEWLVWNPLDDRVCNPVKFETLDKTLNFVRDNISKQVELMTQSKVDPNNIEIVGIKKIKCINE